MGEGRRCPETRRPRRTPSACWRHAGYPHEALTYDPSLHSAVEVAAALGVPAERVYKTLVVLPETPAARPLLVMLAGPHELDLRLLARETGYKAVRMAPRRAAEQLTGLQVGGIGALALTHQRFAVYLDRTALAHDWILVNGGRRGLQLRLAVTDLVRLTGARVIAATAEAAASG
jgi:Cys-tRNA(Pro)/Cys-tRNA(Cys) deacylase